MPNSGSEARMRLVVSMPSSNGRFRSSTKISGIPRSMALLLGQVGLMFGLHDYCALMLLGFFCVSFVTTSSLLNGLAMTLIGVLLGLVGTDLNSGISRF